MAVNEHLIVGVEKHSIAHKLHIRKGDFLVSVNGEKIRDIFDYRFLIEDEYIDLEIRRANGKLVTFEIEKDFGDDLGLEFDSSLMDDYRSCSNKCIFCFIDQMPPGMRETLYFKDDDSRLSFLQGNYVTLTNMKEEDIRRIIRYRMEPINISVHATDKDLRCRMLNNRFAGDVLRYIDMLHEAGILMNGQIVLCKEINDGEMLDKTISDLSKYAPVMESVSVVPVGLTKYRDGLHPMEPFDKNDAIKIIKQIENWQKKIYNEHGIHFIHASDELYLLAGMDLPEEGRYDGYLQLENGVGMLRLLEREFHDELSRAQTDGDEISGRHLTVATGRLSAPYVKQLADDFVNLYGGRIDVIEIKNNFFGEMITVSGLICGCDLKEQLAGKDFGDELLLPVNMFRSGEEYFLDDVTKDELEKFLNVKIKIVPRDGADLFGAFAGRDFTDYRRQNYEQADSGDSWQA
ncbi:MAG: DUF512 domain-containing protein [Lachnospiraceae bacterium]|nr:DUF512 domain-containing protein [Lachnospiraceae bacterium]